MTKSHVIVQPSEFTVGDLNFLKTDVVIKKSGQSFFEVGYLIVGKDSRLLEISKALRKANMGRNKYGPNNPYPPFPEK